MTPDIIRAWAKSQGIPIGDRGRVSQSIREAWQRAQVVEAAKAHLGKPYVGQSEAPPNPPGVQTPTTPPTLPTLIQQQRQGPVLPYVPHCPRCETTWTGLSRAHCGACHLTFNSVGAFDKHRSNDRCLTPASLKMILTGGLWRQADERDWADVGKRVA